MKKLMGLFLTIILFTAVTAFPQDKTDYSKFPGYVDFGSLSKFMSGDNVTEINLDANLLKMLSKMGNEDSKDFKDVVGGLKLIRVNSFELKAANEQDIKDKLHCASVVIHVEPCSSDCEHCFVPCNVTKKKP